MPARVAVVALTWTRTSPSALALVAAPSFIAVALVHAVACPSFDAMESVAAPSVVV